jgi:hypothetical protein
MTYPTDPNSLSAGGKSLFYATNAEDIDLVAVGGSNARAVRAENDGTINVITGAGDTVAFPFKAGEQQVRQYRKILTSGPTAAIGITVDW